MMSLVRSGSGMSASLPSSTRVRNATRAASGLTGHTLRTGVLTFLRHEGAPAVQDHQKVFFGQLGGCSADGVA